MPVPVLIPFLASALSWLLRDVIVKFAVFAGVFGLVALLAPKAASYLSGFVSPSVFGQAFSSIDPGVWYVIRFFRLDYGVPLIISAFVARFLIRRLPVIG